MIDMTMTKEQWQAILTVLEVSYKNKELSVAVHEAFQTKFKGIAGQMQVARADAFQALRDHVLINA